MSAGRFGRRVWHEPAQPVHAVGGVATQHASQCWRSALMTVLTANVTQQCDG